MGVVSLYAQNYNHNYWVYVDKGASADFIVCGPFAGSDPVITPAAAASGTTCSVPDHPGNQIFIGVSSNFYTYDNATHQALYSYTLDSSRGGVQFNVAHAEVKAWRVFFTNGPMPPGGFPGVDDIAGTCASSSSVANLRLRTAKDSYQASCGTFRN